jgi:2,2-dialkylglycine decarboxylase (pyruvate)
MDSHPEIGEARGMGLFRGIDLVNDPETREPHHALGAATTKRCLELGLSMNIRRRPERGSVWRIAPPLTVTRADIDLAMTIFDQALRESKDAMSRERAPARLAPLARATGS